MNSIMAGVIAGVLRAIFGWAKSNEEFNAKKFIRTLVISAITGAILGIYITDVKEVFALSFIGTVIIEDFLVGLYKRI